MAFDDRVTAFGDAYSKRVVDFGTAISVVHGSHSESEQTVDLCHHRSVGLYGRDIFSDGFDQFVEDSIFNYADAFLCTQYFLLVLFEFGRYIAFGADKRLLANPIGRHFVLMGVAHLNVVAKDVVETDFQRRDAGVLYFSLHHLVEIVFTGGCNQAQFVKFVIDTMSDEVSSAQQSRRVFD